jgi:hypothetical protein
MYRPKPRGTDYIQQLADYIKRNISKGYTPDSLKWALTSQGHSRTEIEKAINMANEQMALQAPKMVEKPVIKVEVEPPVPEEKGFFSKIKGWFS